MTIESAATQSASVVEAVTSQTDAPSPYMRVDGTTSARKRAFVDIERVVEVGEDATAVSVTLHLFKSATWAAGTHTLTVEPINAAWEASSVNWTNQPGVRTPSAAVTVPAAGAAGDEITVDISTMFANALAENNATGTRWYGVRLTLNTAVEGSFYSAFADPDYRPYISLDEVLPPDAPDDLSPSDGRAVPKTKPLFLGTFTDDEADDYITGIQVQVDNLDDFVTPDYDSGQVAHDEPAFDSNSPPAGSAAFTALATATTFYWRMRVRDRHNVWSPWSEPASFIVTAKGALTITAPTITSNTIATPLPTITISFTGTQRTVNVLVEKREGDVIVTHYEVPLQVSTATSFTVPDAYALDYASQYRITARVQDATDREDQRGDRNFVEAQTAFFTVAP